MVNTGHSLEWRARLSAGPVVNISGGPLSYTYSLSHIRLHFGERDLQGSEHHISNYAFPAEVKINLASLFFFYFTTLFLVQINFIFLCERYCFNMILYILQYNLVTTIIINPILINKIHILFNSIFLYIFILLCL